MSLSDIFAAYSLLRGSQRTLSGRLTQCGDYNRVEAGRHAAQLEIHDVVASDGALDRCGSNRPELEYLTRFRANGIGAFAVTGSSSACAFDGDRDVGQRRALFTGDLSGNRPLLCRCLRSNEEYREQHHEYSSYHECTGG